MHQVTLPCHTTVTDEDGPLPEAITSHRRTCMECWRRNAAGEAMGYVAAETIG